MNKDKNVKKGQQIRINNWRGFMKDLAKAIGVVGIAGVVGFYLMITNFSYKAGVIFLGYDAAVGVLLVMWAILANAEPLNKNVPGAC